MLDEAFTPGIPHVIAPQSGPCVEAASTDEVLPLCYKMLPHLEGLFEIRFGCCISGANY